MDDKALANLLEKMKDTSSPAAEEDGDTVEGQTEQEEDADNGIQDEDEEAAALAEDLAGGEGMHDGDERFITRTRAEEWARRAVAVGKLVTKPRGTLNAQ